MPLEADDRWTVGRLLTWTSDFLSKKGAEHPRLDAEVLLAFVFGRPRVELYTRYESEVGEPERSKFRDLVKRRADGAPVAYLVGKKEFFSLPFRVTPAVLIPRADSESVVVEALARLKTIAAPRVVDVGTGSGCLALAIAHQHKAARLVAIDLSPDALEVARSNAKSLGLADRVEFRPGDLLAPIADDEPFDMIVSNPPYIPSDDVPNLEPNVARFEPHLALDGGADGLRVVARLVDEAVARIKPGGHLLIEIGSDQESSVRALVGDKAAFHLESTVRDAGNLPRVIVATRKEK